MTRLPKIRASSEYAPGPSMANAIPTAIDTINTPSSNPRVVNLYPTSAAQKRTQARQVAPPSASATAISKIAGTVQPHDIIAGDAILKAA